VAKPGEVDGAELVAYLDDLLDAAGEDYCPNGLQVAGRPRIRRLITGVSACLELFVKAREKEADAVLVHHGIFWKGDSPVLTGIQYRRVRELILGELNLIAYHLPLDRHAELGNNALAVRAYGLVDLQPFSFYAGKPVGFAGRFPEALTAAELVRRTAEIFGQEPLLLGAGPDPVRSLALISGAAPKGLHEAIDAGYDAYLSGEATEWVSNVAREAGVHYLAAGHHATERLGVRALGEHLAQRFGIDVEFFDVPNPV
jgi:dinuclear metal center YbgI/SA1388 family protein